MAIFCTFTSFTKFALVVRLCIHFPDDDLIEVKTCKKVRKSFPTTGLNRPLGIRKVKAPDFLDFGHNEGDKVVTLKHQPPSPPGVSWYSFLEAEPTPRHMVPSVASEKIHVRRI